MLARISTRGSVLLLAAVIGLPPVAATADAKVVVTIKPLHALVAGVMAGVGTPDLLVKGSSSAHTYALKPSDASTLNRSDIFFRMSETMEPFTAKLARSLPKRVQLVTLQQSKGLKLLPRRTGSTFEDDGHDHGSGKNHGHKHGHDHGHGVTDGHAWLDPDNAKVMVERIVQVLSAKDKPNASKFRANGDVLKSKLDELSTELTRELAPAGKQPFIVFHDALQYFERRFGLKAVGSISVSPEVPPSAQRLSALRGKVMALAAVCVLAEPQFDTRLVANLTEGTKARTGTIDPEGARIEAGPELYFTLLRNLARDLKACLLPA
jgi:zinc transport system substrate-binding protein